MPADDPNYEVRWAVEGSPYTFEREGQARAFARPGQQVVKLRRDVTADSETTMEFMWPEEPNQEL